MDEALTRRWPMALQDERISEAIDRDRARLRKFIRSRVAHPGDAEDILQDVFYELVEAYRMMKPVEQVTAWLFRVARNRITDLFRRKAREGRPDAAAMPDDEGEAVLDDDLPASPEAGPEAEFARNALLEELYGALEELPEEQREVFIAHELEGYSFKELAARSGVSVNTLLSRKHYAVLHLRERLRAIYDD
jgi:RNA polymerase sigma factor (sigma-70 family)